MLERWTFGLCVLPFLFLSSPSIVSGNVCFVGEAVFSAVADSISALSSTAEASHFAHRQAEVSLGVWRPQSIQETQLDISAQDRTSDSVGP